jgi:hypothetical protein
MTDVLCMVGTCDNRKSHNCFSELHPLETCSWAPPGRCLSPQFTNHVRASLVHFLASLRALWNCQMEVLARAVWLLDDFFTKRGVPVIQAQLVAAGCFLIADKLEGIDFNLTVSQLVWSSGKSFTKENLLNMECCIANATNFNFGPRSAIEYFRQDFGHKQRPAQFRSLAFCIFELAMLSADVARHPPSQQAAATLIVAERIYFKTSRMSMPQPFGKLLGPLKEVLASLRSGGESAHAAAIRHRYASHNEHRVAQLLAVFASTKGENPNTAKNM